MRTLSCESVTERWDGAERPEGGKIGMQQYEKKKLPKDVEGILEYFGADLSASGEPDEKPDLEEMVKDTEEGSHANS